MSLAPGKTLKEELVSTKLDSNVTNQVSSICNSKPFTVYADHFGLYQEYENTKLKADPITAEVNFWSNNINKFEELEPEFVLFWAKKLTTAHPKIIEDLKAIINLEDTTLQEISDSLGLVFEPDTAIDSRYTPMFDVDLESNTPIPYGHILDAKLNVDIKTNIVQGSTKVNSLFNQNIKEFVQQSSPETSHGGNLVTDFTHINRIVENKTDLLEAVADKLRGAFESFVYLSSYKLNNLQEVINVTFEKDVEGQKVKVDIKGNTIQKDKIANTKDLLL